MEINAGGWRLYDRKATRGKWGELSATLVVAGSSQSPHSSALMTYDDNEEQTRLHQSLGELCRRCGKMVVITKCVIREGRGSKTRFSEGG